MVVTLRMTPKNVFKSRYFVVNLSELLLPNLPFHLYSSARETGIEGLKIVAVFKK